MDRAVEVACLIHRQMAEPEWAGFLGCLMLGHSASSLELSNPLLVCINRESVWCTSVKENTLNALTRLCLGTRLQVFFIVISLCVLTQVSISKMEDINHSFSLGVKETSSSVLCPVPCGGCHLEQPKSHLLPSWLWGTISQHILSSEHKAFLKTLPVSSNSFLGQILLDFCLKQQGLGEIEKNRNPNAFCTVIIRRCLQEVENLIDICGATFWWGLKY